jgi:hypothetical protein
MSGDGGEHEWPKLTRWAPETVGLDSLPNVVYCQLCLVRLARHHVGVPSPAGRVEHADYCASCYKAKCEKPPLHARFPRPRITIKAIMIVVCALAVANAFADWTTRSSSVSSTPQQLRARAFLTVNVEVGFWAAWSF